MGYCINVREVKGLSFDEECIMDIMKDFKTWAKESTKSLRYISEYIIQRCEDIEELFEELRLELEFDEKAKKYKIVGFLGENMGEEDKIFGILSKYLSDGHIQFFGEDGERITYKIKDHELDMIWT